MFGFNFGGVKGGQRLKVAQTYLKTCTQSLKRIRIMEICCLSCTLTGGSGDGDELRIPANERESSHPSRECLKRRELSDDPGNVVCTTLVIFKVQTLAKYSAVSSE